MKNSVLLLILLTAIPIFSSCNHSSADTKTTQYFGDDTVTLKTIAKNYFNKKLARKLGGGRDVATSFGDNGLIIRAGDLNGDNLNDIVLEYAFEPTIEDNGGGGNAIGLIDGFVIYINNGKKIVYKGSFTDFPLNKMINIENNIINTYTLDYADTDARCCPSIYHPIQLKYTGKKLVELK